MILHKLISNCYIKGSHPTDRHAMTDNTRLRVYVGVGTTGTATV